MELNEQTLEQILTRQREKYQRHLDELRHDFKQYCGGSVAGRPPLYGGSC